MVPNLFGVTLLIFALFNLFGGDPATRFAGRHATAEQVANIRAELGLNGSLPEQYLFFVKQVVTFDFGRSWATKQQIKTMLHDGIGASLTLIIPPFLASTFFCLFLALFTTYLRGTWLDKGIVVTCLGLMSISSLVYILALQYFLAFDLGWFPISGWDPSWTGRWAYLTLPWIIMFVLSLGPDILIYRAIVIDEAFQDYVRTAKAKGVSPLRILSRHILRNVMIPVITIIAIEMPLLLTGTVLVESFFGIPGVGGMLVHSLYDSDFPCLKAMTVIISLIYMVFNLLADVLYAVFDPRIRLS